MKKIFTIAFVVTSLIASAAGQSEKEAFKPHGKPLALIFTNFNYSIEDGSALARFQIKRAYLGYEYNFSPSWYGKAVLDVGDPRDGGSYQQIAFLKNAYFQYKKARFSAAFGMVSTTQFKVSEKIWGYRYMMKSFQDEFGFNSSADLGFVLDYKFADWVSLDFSVYNGEGYKKLEADSVLRPALGLTFHPVQKLTARIYGDWMGTDVKQKSLAAFLAYTGSKLVVGAEYNQQNNYQNLSKHNIFGTSVFATYVVNDKIKVFARYDMLDSSTLEGESNPWHMEKNGQLIMAGVEFNPVKGVKLTPNVRNWSYQEVNVPSRVDLFLNCEVKF